MLRWKSLVEISRRPGSVESFKQFLKPFRFQLFSKQKTSRKSPLHVMAMSMHRLESYFDYNSLFVFEIFFFQESDFSFWTSQSLRVLDVLSDFQDVPVTGCSRRHDGSSRRAGG